MNWKSYNGKQKLLVVIGSCVVIGALLLVLQLWGIDFGSDFLEKTLVTLGVVALACGILYAIMSNIHDDKKDKDNFYN